MQNPGPHQLEKMRVMLATTGDMELRKVTPNFYQDLVRDYEQSGSSLISMFDFDEPWDVWEMHPEGDEFVFLLQGDTDFTLHDGQREVGRVRISRPGDYLLVPRGIWHRAHPRVPTSMLFVTPGDGTVNAAEPGGVPLEV